MIIPDLLTTTAKLPAGLNDSELDLAIMKAGVIWDDERELVKKLYSILEDYRNEVD